MFSSSVVLDSLWPLGLSHEAPLSMEFSRQEHWSGSSVPPLGDLLDPGIEPISPALQVNSLPSDPLEKLRWTVFIKIFSLLSPFVINHYAAAAVAAKSLQSCLTLCDPMDGSPPGSPVLGILQARTLEWVAISFSNVWKWKVKGKSLRRVWLLATPLTTAYQAPPAMGFSRQECWSGVPLITILLITIINGFIIQ